MIRTNSLYKFGAAKNSLVLRNDWPWKVWSRILIFSDVKEEKDVNEWEKHLLVNSYDIILSVYDDDDDDNDDDDDDGDDSVVESWPDDPGETKATI